MTTTELTVLDPRTGDVVTQVATADANACDAAVDRAHSAFAHWSRTPAAERAESIRQAAAAVEAVAGELAEVNACETGKSREDSLGGRSRRHWHAQAIR
ncbi:aldehyde dehydrogenase family protein [Hoyosella sp. YIM 151337]|uniref:aldehyde dehydrogenase family protein n=1 Tax=Hoyosella sp. YIM 151337 TaxID=2992742 RepID=UPI0022358876|nr:aldehyde dehydrogenase family protein [Hoyosella sp. YIM 151337]MCW4353707.1 aldehyde dehydrogenase family protein [Hoyosella sp. YIM 151337]